MTWQRLEGTTIDADLVESTEARLADPLWLIGKQWQVGELTGDDAADPILMECDVVFTPITRFQGGAPAADGAVVERAALGIPLETAVEREEVRDGPAATRLAAEAGLQLLRMLDQASAPRSLRGALRAALPLQLPDDDGLDPYGRLQLELLARRSFDAATLYDRLARGESLPPGLSQPPATAAVAAWRAWYTTVFSEPSAGDASWQPPRMEYRFRIAASPAAGQEVTLEAPEYLGDHLDWYTFDVRDDLAALGAPAALERRHVQVAPTPARYAGQAASRWWQVEDGEVWFGDLHTGSTDLARAAVGGFGAGFGDDWFQVPIRLPAGVLARIERLTIHDTFGESHNIRSCAELDGPGRNWRFFELTGDASADAPELSERECPWLFLSPVLPGLTESEPLEEVVFIRDEQANLGWALELRVESQAGRSVDRVAAARAARQPAPTATGDAWRYLLGTPVLDNEIPLVPVRAVDGGLHLQRGRLATGVSDGEVTAQGALGEILEPTSTLLLEDGEVPPTGIRVARCWRMARTADGGVVCWVGRRKTPTAPRRSPDLAFDEVVRPSGPIVT